MFTDRGEKTRDLTEGSPIKLLTAFIIPYVGFMGVCFAAPAAWVLVDIYLFPLYFILHKNLKRVFHLRNRFNSVPFNFTVDKRQKLYYNLNS